MKNKIRLIKIVVAFVLFASTFFVPDIKGLKFALYLLAYLVVGGEIIVKAFRNLYFGRMLDENFLMTIATIGAFALRQYSEGVAVMLFYQVGELFQSYAVNKSRRSIAALMDIRPEYARVKRSERLEKVSPEKVNVGEIIIVKPGEKIPLDGSVVEGVSLLDTSALTGESVPRKASAGDEVLSGCVNLNSVLTIRVEKEYGNSTVSKILDLVENASSKKARIENFITRFARYYTPLVVLAALMIAFLPPLFSAATPFREWIYRALTFLVVSCPCALVISVPLGFFGGIGAASRNGILVKGGNYLEALSKAEIVVFDKTGTLTKGIFQVSEIFSPLMSQDAFLKLAAYADSFSNHPVALSILKAYGKPIEEGHLSGQEELSGYGVKAFVDGVEVLLGNASLMEKGGIPYEQPETVGTIIHGAVDGAYAGWIRISDEIKPDAAEAIKRLKKEGVRLTVMLTGDTPRVAEAVAQEVGVDEVFSSLLPAQKVEKMEDLEAKKSKNGRLVFVGDGINDAPVLARSDVGIAMGGVGSDAAVEAADIVLMTDEPTQVADAIRISRKTLRIVRQNILFALGVKGAVLLMGAIGMATMWEAVFADVGVSVLAIMNSARALRYKR